MYDTNIGIIPVVRGGVKFSVQRAVFGVGLQWGNRLAAGGRSHPSGQPDEF